MKNAVTPKEVIYTFAKLEPLFELCPLYRMNGFFDRLDEIIAYFVGKVEVAYRVVADRVLTNPEKLRERDVEFDKTQYPEGYDGTMEDWLEENSQVGDIYFCVAVCMVAHVSYDKAAKGLSGYITGNISKNARARLVTVISTMQDLSAGVNGLLVANN